MRYNMLIKGGTIVDGSGAAAYRGDVRVDEGRIVERGTHAELLALGGEYYDLHQLQTRTEQGLSTADAKIRRKVAEGAE